MNNRIHDFLQSTTGAFTMLIVFYLLLWMLWTTPIPIGSEPKSISGWFNELYCYQEFGRCNQFHSHKGEPVDPELVDCIDEVGCIRLGPEDETLTD